MSWTAYSIPARIALFNSAADNIELCRIRMSDGQLVNITKRSAYDAFMCGAWLHWSTYTRYGKLTLDVTYDDLVRYIDTYTDRSLYDVQYAMRGLLAALWDLSYKLAVEDQKD